jgi:hypothetical protein
VTPSHAAVEALGWAATAVFVASYFFTRADALVKVQIAGALMWVAYGLVMRAPPVVAANVLVMGAATWKARQARRAEQAGQEQAGRPAAVR